MANSEASLPEATRTRVSILFTDLEASTQWLYEKGPHVVFRSLEKHFSILAKAFADHDGSVVKRTGDGVMAAFGTTEKAIRAAVLAQQLLAKERSEGSTPLNLPAIRMGISTGEAYVVRRAGEDTDYFGRVCAEASRILDLAYGHHILIAADALGQEEFGRDAMISDGIEFTDSIRVYRKGLDDVSVCEASYRLPAGITDDMRNEIGMSVGGLIEPQVISRSRPDIAPFSYFENTRKAKPDIDQFLLQSHRLDFLHIRGLVGDSNSPFNRFARLASKGAFDHQIEDVRVGVIHPECDWLDAYYTGRRSFEEEIVRKRIEECQSAVKLAQTKLECFQLEGKIRNWKVFLYQHVPVWRLIISERGVFATPYGGTKRTDENIVLFAEASCDSIYDSFSRYFEYVLETSVVRPA
ncbi:MAG: adenylate/guanylate cyclase domain-containing protein [bacterium]|nr:adenylate/guanylate cyclase domain-containing protein [bacterium]